MAVLGCRSLVLVLILIFITIRWLCHLAVQWDEVVRSIAVQYTLCHHCHCWNVHWSGYWSCQWRLNSLDTLHHCWSVPLCGSGGSGRSYCIVISSCSQCSWINTGCYNRVIHCLLDIVTVIKMLSRYCGASVKYDFTGCTFYGYATDLQSLDKLI